MSRKEPLLGTLKGEQVKEWRAELQDFGWTEEMHPRARRSEQVFRYAIKFGSEVELS